MILESLPDEVLLIVISFLDIPDLVPCLLVCQRFRRLATDPTLLHTRLAYAARWLDYTRAATTGRPSPRNLAGRNILLSPIRLAPGADPSRTRLLQTIPRRMKRDILNRLLANRPSRQDLIARNIVPFRLTRLLDYGPITAQQVVLLERRRLADTLAACLAPFKQGSPRKPAARIIIVYSPSQRLTYPQEPAAGFISPHFKPDFLVSSRPPREEFLLLKRPVSALVHMFACTAMWLTGPPPPPPPPLPGSNKRQDIVHVHRVPQICSLFEKPVALGSSARPTLDGLSKSSGRVAMLRQLFV